jgi:hypothetical protein
LQAINDMTYLDRLMEVYSEKAAIKFHNLGMQVDNLSERINFWEGILIKRPKLSIYHHTPVGIREFIESPEFLNKKGVTYPKVMEELEEINSGKYVETIFTGGIGCVPFDTEFLTPTGWKTFSSYTEGDKVAQYDISTKKVTYITPLDYIDAPSDGWFKWENKRSFEMQVSPEHRVLWSTEYKKDLPLIETANTLANRHLSLVDGLSGCIPSCFSGGQEGISLTDEELRLMVSFLADGNLHPYVKKEGEFAGRKMGRVTVRKERKKERLLYLLNACSIKFTTTTSKNRPTEECYSFYPPIETKSYAFLWKANQSQLEIITQELKYWDGLFSDEELRFYTADKEAADFVQYAWAAIGHKSYIGVRSSSSRGGRKALYIVTTSHAYDEGYKLRGTTCGYIPPTENERKYCFSVPTGFMVVRQHGKIFITGNSAKTHSALYTLAYQLYLFSNMVSPHKVFGLDPSSEILIVFQSLNARLAKALDFNRFKSMIDGSPYFKKRFPYNKDIESRLDFPNRISVVPLTGQETAAIGQNVISCLLDEVNYMSIVENSKNSIDGGVYDQATALYNSIARRRKSRFASTKALPGMLCLVSSKRYPGQFTDIKEEEAKTDPTIYIYDKRVWDIKPSGSFSGQYFQIFVGDEGRQPRVLGDAEYIDPSDRHLIDNIPIEYKHDFERDIINSLREIAGKSTLSSHPFIVNTAAITRCMDRPLEDSIFGSEFCDFVQYPLFLQPENFHKPKLARAVHIDLGITGDSAGIVVGTVVGFEQSIRDDGFPSETLPKYHIDGCIEVRPPKSGEILFWKIRSMILKLKELGLNIKWVSLDSFQSRDTLQILRQQGLVTGELSIDRTMLPYEVTKTAIYDHRISMPKHTKLRKELATLEKNAAKGKVDHPSLSGASKDCSDALAGVVYTLLSRREIWAEHNIPIVDTPAYLKGTKDKMNSQTKADKSGDASIGMYTSSEREDWKNLK